jgi:class 3 adenylate cyclase
VSEPVEVRRQNHGGHASAGASLEAEDKQQGFIVWLRNLTLKSKLLLMLLPIGLLSMAIQAVLGHMQGRRSMVEQGYESLVAVRQSKKQQIEALFTSLRDTFPTIAEDMGVVAATSQFRDSFGQLGRTRLSDERRGKLESYYRDTYVPTLAKRSPDGSVPAFEQLWPRTDRAIEAQTLFLVENTFKSGERARLTDHPISNPYTLAHFTFHTRLRDIAQRLKLYDLFIVDADVGNVVYSVEKEPDFGTSLLDGPYANTNIGRLFRRVLAEHKRGYVALADFEDYAPSLLTPQLFIASPIYSNFKLTGVLIGQLSVDGMNAAVNGSNSWKQDGLGDSGIVYISGPAPGRLMRSNHRGFIENKDAFISALKGTGIPDAALEPLRRSSSTVLRVGANVEAIERAQRGETGTMVGTSIVGKRALQAYAPLRIQDLDWVLLAQKNESEVLASVSDFQRQMMVLAGLLALGTALLSSLLASRFLRPVERLMTGVQSIRAGNTNTTVEPASTDEFGQLTGHFNDMTAQLRERDAKLAEKAESNALLLRRLFPANVADRMVKGETQIVDLVPNVTVVYASIIGFAAASDGKPAADSMALLNELFDLFDAQAAEHGIDRVKTIGEHFIAACGLTEPRLDHAERAVAFCDGMARELKRLNAERGLQLQMRAALASGDINAGLIGDRRFVFEIWGRPLNYARRLIHEAATGEIRIADATNKLLGSDNGFKDRAAVEGRTLGTIRNYGRLINDEPIKVVLTQAAE